jgi:hypothetical protein
MDKAFVELGTLLNDTPENVKAALTGNDEAAAIGIITKFKESHKVYSNADFEAYQNNLKQNYVSELATLAKQGKAPQELHAVIKGSVLEQTTKKLAEKYGITDPVTSIEDLTDKLQKKDVSAEKIAKELEAVKADYVKNMAEKDELLSKRSEEVDNELANIHLSNTLNSMPLDYKAEAIDKQRELLNNAVNANYTRKWDRDKKTVVFFKGEQMLKDPKTLEPLKSSEVYRMTAVDYGFNLKQESTSGRGDSGTGAPITTTKEEWIAARKATRPGGTLLDADYKEFNQIFQKPQTK